MTRGYIGSKGDGLSNSVMLSENLTAWLWGYKSEQNRTTVPDKQYHFGVCWEMPDQVTGTSTEYKTHPSFRRINGQRIDNAVLFDTFADEPTTGMQPNYGFPSSNHPGGVNIAFCDGRVVFVTDEITPTVYAQLMTTNRKGSDLVATVNGQTNTPESRMKQPSDNDF